MIPVVDIFAGPGGLGEGFANARDKNAKPLFQIRLSVEKDPVAHKTLRLRSFVRQFRKPPADYLALIEGLITVDELYQLYPRQAELSQREAIQLELGKDSAMRMRTLVDNALPANTPWALIGGPPCQAYSLIGRARNRGIAGYVAESDERQTLYVDYLQILADHAPPVFVMENVKGLLSATFERNMLFERILADLRDPAIAIKREGRSRPRQSAKYSLYPLNIPSALFEDPRDFVVKTEEYGIPQARHRVIILGVRDDIKSRPGTLKKQSSATVKDAIEDLPRLRSGITDHPDSPANWIAAIRAISKRAWISRQSSAIRYEIKDAIDHLTSPRADRGAEFIRKNVRGAGKTEVVLNHSSRAHIAADLERYLFVSCFGRATNRSPTLRDFPVELMPAHKSAVSALEGSNFADRFRVQLASRPATTITSHIAKDGHYYIHYDPTQCRSLTVREAARLQTFPDDYFFCGPRTSQYHQVGNAVPPALAGQIAKIVADLLR